MVPDSLHLSLCLGLYCCLHMYVLDKWCYYWTFQCCMKVILKMLTMKHCALSTIHQLKQVSRWSKPVLPTKKGNYILHCHSVHEIICHNVTRPHSCTSPSFHCLLALSAHGAVALANHQVALHETPSLTKQCFKCDNSHTVAGALTKRHLFKQEYCSQQNEPAGRQGMCTATTTPGRWWCPSWNSGMVANEVRQQRISTPNCNMLCMSIQLLDTTFSTTYCNPFGEVASIYNI